MQEVEVAARDVFIHYINVQKDKTILWSFTTKRKNISFGLYQRKGHNISTSTNSHITTANNIATVANLNLNTTLANSIKNNTTGATPTTSTIKEDGGGSGGIGHNSGYGIPNSARPSLKSNISITSVDTNDTEDTSDSSQKDNNNSAEWTNSTSTLNPLHSPSTPGAAINGGVNAFRGRKKSVSLQIIKDPGLKEILPIEHYNSATATIKGSYKVQDEGIYCLVFGSDDDQDKPLPETSGWMLKKKRKKIQGWAKRWVQIDNGILSYYQFPDGPCRGSIHIAFSAVSSSQPYRSITLDSGTATYHFKTLTDEEFESWMSFIRKYINLSKDLQILDSEYPIISSPRQSTEFERHQSIYRKRQSLIERRQSLIKRRHSLTRDPQAFFRSNKLEEDLGKIYDHLNSMDDKFNTIDETLETLKNSIESPVSPFAIPKASPSVEGKFRLKKFTLQKAVKDDKKKILDLLRIEFEKWKALDHAYRKLSAENAELRKQLSNSVTATTTMEKSDHFYNNDGDAEYQEKLDNGERIYKRAESLSTINTDVFFDAEDIVLTSETINADDSEGEVSNVEIIEDESEDESSSLDASFNDDATKKDDENIEVKVDDDDSVDKAEPSQKISEATRKMTIRRRKILPSPICGEEVSLLSLLRKNVGKDMSTIAMPISLNEPINLLQKLAEDLEYSELLDKANSSDDSLMRLMYVAAFAVSGYASSQYRTGRKPFNPLHGETYELVHPVKGFKFISEKVSHHPPIMACHAESPNWIFWQDSKAKSKFWGKSMEVIPYGTVHIKLPKNNDHFSFNKPTTWMRNMISGTKYLEHTGVIRIQNQTTKEVCEITFTTSGLWSSGPKSEIVGVLFSSTGKKCGKIVGRWNEIIFNEKAPNQLEVLWKANPPLPNYEEYYGFMPFTIELNEITPDISEYLPNTDTRLRPDQRLFEDGAVDQAEGEKLRLEQKQREFRKELETQGKTWEPQWFELKDDEWVYKGGLGALSTCEGLDFHYKTTKSSNKPTKPTSDSPSSPTTVPENPSSTAAPENPSSPAPENPNNPNNPSPQPTPDPNNPNNPPPANPNPSNPNPTTSLPVLASAKVASDVAPPVPLKNGKMTGLLIFYQPSDGKTSITGYLNNLLDDVEGKYTFKIVNDKGTVINDLTGMINPIFQLGGSSTFSTIQDSVRLSGDPATNALGSFFVITQRDVAICKALIGKEFVIDG
ncbi:621_t:CDS:10 [Entrophospora sp. SA101]|nr:621_t:CDS:10 [Entrophospora sp. SA101]